MTGAPSVDAAMLLADQCVICVAFGFGQDAAAAISTGEWPMVTETNQISVSFSIDRNQNHIVSDGAYRNFTQLTE